MTIDAWVRSALADARSRGRRELEPLIEALARATRVLRDADVTDASGAGLATGIVGGGAPREPRRS
jgi:hypothetical protein